MSDYVQVVSNPDYLSFDTMIATLQYVGLILHVVHKWQDLKICQRTFGRTSWTWGMSESVHRIRCPASDVTFSTACPWMVCKRTYKSEPSLNGHFESQWALDSHRHVIFLMFLWYWIALGLRMKRIRIQLICNQVIELATLLALHRIVPRSTQWYTFFEWKMLIFLCRNDRMTLTSRPPACVEGDESPCIIVYLSNMCSQLTMPNTICSSTDTHCGDHRPAKRACMEETIKRGQSAPSTFGIFLSSSFHSVSLLCSPD